MSEQPSVLEYFERVAEVIDDESVSVDYRLGALRALLRAKIAYLEEREQVRS